MGYGRSQAAVFSAVVAYVAVGFLTTKLMKTKPEILDAFNLFNVPTGGIGSWLTDEAHDDIFTRLGRINEEPLSAVQLNQLLVLGHEAPVDDGYFRYYWL